MPPGGARFENTTDAAQYLTEVRARIGTQKQAAAHDFVSYGGEHTRNEWEAIWNEQLNKEYKTLWSYEDRWGFMTDLNFDPEKDLKRYVGYRSDKDAKEGVALLQKAMQDMGVSTPSRKQTPRTISRPQTALPESMRRPPFSKEMELPRKTVMVPSVQPNLATQTIIVPKTAPERPTSARGLKGHRPLSSSGRRPATAQPGVAVDTSLQYPQKLHEQLTVKKQTNGRRPATASGGIIRYQVQERFEKSLPQASQDASYLMRVVDATRSQLMAERRRPVSSFSRVFHHSSYERNLYEKSETARLLHVLENEEAYYGWFLNNNKEKTVTPVIQGKQERSREENQWRKEIDNVWKNDNYQTVQNVEEALDSVPKRIGSAEVLVLEHVNELVLDGPAPNAWKEAVRQDNDNELKESIEESAVRTDVVTSTEQSQIEPVEPETKSQIYPLTTSQHYGYSHVSSRLLELNRKLGHISHH